MERNKFLATQFNTRACLHGSVSSAFEMRLELITGSLLESGRKKNKQTTRQKNNINQQRLKMSLQAQLLSLVIVCPSLHIRFTYHRADRLISSSTKIDSLENQSSRWGESVKRARALEEKSKNNFLRLDILEWIRKAYHVKIYYGHRQQSCGKSARSSRNEFSSVLVAR